MNPFQRLGVKISNWWRGEPQDSGGVVTLNSPSFLERIGLKRKGKPTSEVTYFTCLKMLSETLAKMPIKYYQKTDKGIIEAEATDTSKLLSKRPNPFMTPTTFWNTVVVEFFHGYKRKQLLTACEAVLVEIRNQFRHFLHGHIKHQFKDFHVVIIVDVTIYLACGNQTVSVFLFFFIRHVSHLLSIAGRIHRPAALLPVDNLCDFALDDCIFVNRLHIETVTNLETCHVLIP